MVIVIGLFVVHKQNLHITCAFLEIPSKKMNFMLKHIGLLLFYVANQNCQYNVVRTNPFERLTTTLKTFQAEGCDGGVLGITCPERTKVLLFVKTSL